MTLDDAVLVYFIGDELEVAEAQQRLPLPTPVPRFAAETVRPGAKS